MPRWLTWLAGLGAASVALAAWLLLWDPRSALERQEDRLQARQAVIHSEYLITAAQLDRIAKLARVRQLLSAEPQLVVSMGPRVPAGIASHLAAAATREFAPAASPRASVLIADVAAQVRTDPRVAVSRSKLDFLAGVERGAGFCAAVGQYPHAGSLRPRELERLTRQPLGPCRYWARYGAPGAGVAHWLAAGAIDFARDGRVLAPLPDSLRSPRLFGARRVRLASLALAGCQLGDTQRCRRELMAPRGPATPAMMADTLIAAEQFGLHWAALVPFDFSQHLFAALEAEFGRARMQAFWTSADDVETAFRRSFGLPMDAWAMHWLQESVGRAPTGPGLAAPTLLLSLLTLGLLLGAAMTVNRRRTV